MTPNARYYSTLFILLFLSLTTNGQTFYVNADITYSRPNMTYKLNASTCDTFVYKEGDDSLSGADFTCRSFVQPDPWVDTTYNDIAIDKFDNLWYVTQSGLLYNRKLSDTTSCQYIGDFTADRSITGGLVADNDGNLYAASNLSDYCTIHKYSSSGFSILGMLPKNVYCSGDLFFYEHRLFMTCSDPKQDSSFIYEIMLKDPKQSCYYMPTQNFQSYGAVSIEDGPNTKVLISATNRITYESSSLVEIDIPNRKILDTLCNYPFLIRGAACYYEQTGDSAHCPYIPNSVSEWGKHAAQYLTVYNPSSSHIRISTNLGKNDINTIHLCGLTGKLVKAFDTDQFPDNLNISEIPNGLYMLHITSKDGRRWNEKLLKSGNW